MKLRKCMFSNQACHKTYSLKMTASLGNTVS